MTVLMILAILVMSFFLFGFIVVGGLIAWYHGEIYYYDRKKRLARQRIGP
jgi:hypothetical protein